ncbi:hypothetical protein KKP04_06380 [Rhodomicrobium sp. Az07]|uniref:hypothetical protein n=1 Tax=Rhodomicrobium sp. Az07 TaxID=2839034 RepID=UPI001BE91BA0|nr:hypothetical protein [Rhodomicrobium sp. Az07]MBT3070491.1 hypothetical protein [Rhodomicrobium sp. Az07]
MFKAVVASCTAGLMLAAASPAFALCSSQGLELMKSLNGAWKGRGAVTPIGGSPERIACRISYSLAGGDKINQIIVCAGTAWKIEAASRVTCMGNRVEGLFEEKVAHNTGAVTGSIDGNQLIFDADSPHFRGRFHVTFKETGSHAVSITQFDSAKGRQVPVASVQLTR